MLRVVAQEHGRPEIELTLHEDVVQSVIDVDQETAQGDAGRERK
jgi:hypothetical protein